jgi:hypothetical protein
LLICPLNLPQYLVYLAFLAFELAYIFFFLIETKGKTLEETAAIFDGQQQIDNIANVGHDAATQSRHHYAFQQKSNDIELSPSRHNSMVPTNVIEGGNSDWRLMSADTNFSNKKEARGILLPRLGERIADIYRSSASGTLVPSRTSEPNVHVSVRL